jgi:RHS repeat-associated protein
VTRVTLTYNGLGYQVTQDYQLNNYSAGTVGYNYAQDFGSANYSRLAYMTYPNGRKLHYGYDAGVDDAASRVSYLADDNGTGLPGSHLEEYDYLGLGTVVDRYRPEPGARLTYVTQNTGDEPTGAGDQYTGLDRFGRIVDQRWRKTTGTPADLDRFKYGYDRGGNRLYKENTLSAANSELYHAGGSTGGYDKLNRLTAFKRGTLNTAKDDVTGTPSVNKTWGLDALGNWDSVTGETQNRTHNKRNQLTSRTGIAITYDANGNLTADERGFTYKYDAWNRLREVRNGSALERQYFYDALGRRMVEVGGDLLSTVKRFYHSLDWQVVEEQESDSCTCGVVRTRTQYVWGMGFVDQMVLRDHDADNNAATGSLGQSASGMEQRLYAQQDANYNVTSVTNTSGAVQERYLYDAYGAVTYKTGSWGNRSSSSYAQVYLFQGLRLDSATGFYHARNRDFSPVYGRWIQQDPLLYVDGSNLYEAYLSGPVNNLDPEGTRNVVRPPVREHPVIRNYNNQVNGNYRACPSQQGWTNPQRGPRTQPMTMRAAPGSRRCPPKNCQDHHIATPYSNENRVGRDIGAVLNGLLRQGGVDINRVRDPNGDPFTNGCPVCDVGDGRTHAGPHDPRYHIYIAQQLGITVDNARLRSPFPARSQGTQDRIKNAIDRLFNKLCKRLNTPGDALRDMVTRPPRER